jgi:hypothetical protein
LQLNCGRFWFAFPPPEQQSTLLSDIRIQARVCIVRP